MSTVTGGEDDGGVTDRLMDALEEWQDGPRTVPLWEFLDLSEDEYERWLADSSLPPGYRGRLL